jgi:hypothetical protein
MLLGSAETSGHQQRANFVAIQTDGVGLIIQAGSADVDRRRVVQKLLFYRVPVEPRHRAQSAGHGGAGGSPVLHVSAEAFDVSAAGLEQVQVDAVGTTM